MKIRNVLVIPFLLLVLTAVSCGNSKSRNDRTETVDKEVIKAPEFDADSARYKQTSVPVFPTHRRTKNVGNIWQDNWKSSAPRYTINMPI
mgnify:CR=1 FL=1